MQKKILLPIAVICLFLSASPVLAQEATLTLRMRRDFGYSSGTGDIQGNFSLRTDGPAELVQVDYLIDGVVIGSASEAPFSFAFTTDSFPQGIHTIEAIGSLPDGTQLTSNEIRVNFVSAEQGWKTAGRIITPILLIAFGVILFSFLIPLLVERRASAVPLGKPRSYGMLGGTICPNCQRPYALHIYGMNLLAGKLDRCPHCGKWRLVRRVPLEILRTAETAEKARAEGESPELGLTDEERLRKDLDDSRYQNL